jgi:hypothetical protein
MAIIGFYIRNVTNENLLGMFNFKVFNPIWGCIKEMVRIGGDVKSFCSSDQ